jgi:hypothetical protein
MFDVRPDPSRGVNPRAEEAVQPADGLVITRQKGSAVHGAQGVSTKDGALSGA